LLTVYAAQVLFGVDDELSALGYDLMVSTTHNRRTKESTYVRTLTQGIADGLLLLLPEDSQGSLQALRERHFPYVVIDHQGFDSFSPTVVASNQRGAHEATAYLLCLGHRRIGFIAWTAKTSSAFERLEGYRAALAAQNVPFDPALVSAGNFVQPDGFVAAQKLLDLDPPPTAFFAANDESAFGAIEAIRSRGLTIPGDLSIVGFDDIPRAAYMFPPLTTVRQPLIDMGRAAARLLLTYIQEPERAAERVVLDTQIVLRESCAPPRRSH
jgi:LacI family transcriptional regulator